MIPIEGWLFVVALVGVFGGLWASEIIDWAKASGKSFHVAGVVLVLGFAVLLAMHTNPWWGLAAFALVFAIAPLSRLVERLSAPRCHHCGHTLASTGLWSQVCRGCKEVTP